MALSLIIWSQFKCLQLLTTSILLDLQLGSIHSGLSSLYGVSLFAENWLSLPTIATLLPAIAPLSLRVQRTLAHLVLCYSVGLMLATLPTERPGALGTLAIFVRALWAQRVLPLSRYGQADGVLSLSLNANEDTIKLTGLLQELYEMILSWHLPEYELGQYEFMVSHVLSKKNVGYRVEPMCKFGCKT